MEPGSAFTLDELARLFTAAYEDYVVPFQIDEATLRFMVAAFDLDLTSSRVALDDGEPVGLVNLGVRGDRGWVGGVGVVPASRRRGLGERLMLVLLDEARARELRQVTLEVIEQNDPAHRLYEKLGFETTRWLEIWSLERAGGAGAARDVDAEAAHARIRELRSAPEPWQRADETVAFYATLDPAPIGLAVDGGAAVARSSGEHVNLAQIVGDEAACRSLLETLRCRGPVTVLNLPADDPAAGALRSLGAECKLRQREMAIAV
jgi:ribosomal protein S18 acetylase RimI-like enzyme